MFITNANVANSILVKAVTDPEVSYDGISTFIVDPHADDGFELTHIWDSIARQPVRSHSMTFGFPKIDCSASRVWDGARRSKPSMGDESRRLRGRSRGGRKRNSGARRPRLRDRVCPTAVLQRKQGECLGLDPEAVHRDEKLIEIGEGTSQIQRLVLGRELSI